MANGKTRLKCIKTHGRWCKGDEATFADDTAKKLTAQKPPLWVEAGNASTSKKTEPAN